MDASLAEWQERLFLTDWIIKAELHDKNDSDDFGEVNCNVVSQKATIKLYQEGGDTLEIKKCMEKTLVHELLHLSLHLCYYDNNMRVEECVFDTHMHQKVEKLSQSLIMAKYNVPFSWFKNF